MGAEQVDGIWRVTPEQLTAAESSDTLESVAPGAGGHIFIAGRYESPSPGLPPALAFFWASPGGLLGIGIAPGLPTPLALKLAAEKLSAVFAKVPSSPAIYLTATQARVGDARPLAPPAAAPHLVLV